MTVGRIYRMIAKEEDADKLREGLSAVGPFITSQEGCLGVDVFNDQESPCCFLLIEKWESIEHHQAALAAMPDGIFDEVMSCLEEPPEASYAALIS